LRKLGRREEAAKVAERLTALVNRERENSDKLRVDASR